MSAISCRNLCKTFRQGEEIITGLDDVCLDIDEGSFVCLSGPSGSGKTTLLNAMGGLDTPDSGEITVGAHRVDQLSRTELADMRLNNIGFVFQAYNLIPVLTARENVEFVMQVQGIATTERRSLADQVLAEVGLSGLEGRLPAQMSGGQQQRVAVARAIANEPALVLADEPTANVDSKTGKALLDLMHRLNQEKGVTFFFSTHEEAVMKRAHRLLQLEDGIILNDGIQTDKWN